jgi:hypothetical protein
LSDFFTKQSFAMKKNIYLALIFCLFTLINLTNSSCECEDVQVAADLAVTAVEVSKEDVPVNESVDLISSILNLLGADCEIADEAEDFYNDYEVWYKATPTDGFKFVNSLPAGDRQFINKLVAGDDMPFNLGMSFDQPGYYLIRCKTDITEVVDERSETNNSKDSKNVSTRSAGTQESGIIRVYVDENTDMERLAESIRLNRYFTVTK